MRDLDRKYDDLAVHAFPSMQFGGQEHKDDEKILPWVQEKFGWTPAFTAKKADINPEKNSNAYQFLLRCFPGDVTWNFASKFLVDRDGTVVRRFEKEPWDEIEKAIKEAIDTPATGSLNLPSGDEKK